MEAFVERLYRRLGERYYSTFLLWITFVAIATAMLTMLAAIPYLNVPAKQMATLGPLWLAAITVCLVIISVRIKRSFAATIAWIRGTRTPSVAPTVWEELTSEVYASVRFGIMVFLGVAIPSLFIGARFLNVPWYGNVALGLGIICTILIGGLLDYLGVEVLVRPVLRQVAAQLPAGYEPARPSPSLRYRLVAGMMITSLYGALLGAAAASGTDSPVMRLLLGLSFSMLMCGTLVLFVALLLGAAVLSPVNDIVIAMRGVGAGDLDARVAVLGADEVGFLARSFNGMVTGLAEREVLRSAMGTYVAPHMAERILEGTELEGEEVDVSIMFVDIRDFTASADGQDPRETVGSLNEFFALTVPAVIEHGGHANKFLGDGFLAVFGAPERLSDHADRAVQAASAIAHIVAARYGKSLRIGIGVNSGTVVAGSLGGGGRLEFTLIGDAVNVAKRVEQSTKDTGDTILITEATRGRLRNLTYPTAPRGSIPLRGKAQTLEVHALYVTPL